LPFLIPHFLYLGATNYVVAQHGGYSLLGPASLSAPGYSLTPAAPGEAIILYGVGFGMPGGGVTAVSLTQSGVLPSPPSYTVGGKPATTLFAGLISPGLYQINLAVPNPTSTGERDRGRPVAPLHLVQARGGLTWMRKANAQLRERSSPEESSVKSAKD
jgi:uncharacterized protein (TIGR03437 family)